jgi:LmbE family N-acetylglucosaminyl deacetylase
VAETATLSEALTDWQGEGERWLFVTPHDDDVVLGGGMMLEAARDAGIDVHVAVATDGRMGYCHTEQKERITAIRRQETARAFGILGKPEEYWLGYPDCDLDRHTGRRPVETVSGETPDVTEGHTGLQNSLTALLRRLRPTRVFVPTGADYHPDHKAVYRELLISIFHASGAVWPELGEPLAAVPLIYEMAVYCDFPEDPTLQLVGTAEMLDGKLQAIGAYESQEQISALVQAVRDAGPYEYFLEHRFVLYDSRRYAGLFENGAQG